MTKGKVKRYLADHIKTDTAILSFFWLPIVMTEEGNFEFTEYSNTLMIKCSYLLLFVGCHHLTNHLKLLFLLWSHIFGQNLNH